MHDHALGPHAGARAGGGSEPIRLVAAFVLAAGSIHLVALVQHLSEDWRYVAFFSVVAPCQLAWGMSLYRRSWGRWSLVLAAVANLAIAGVWLLSRTVGVPLASAISRPEAPGLLDVFATFDELAGAALIIAILAPRGSRRARVAQLRRAQEIRILTALITLTALGIVLGAHSH